MDLKEKIKTLPNSPGVYLMKNSLDSVIYVGKSKNLKNRVGSYFQNSKSHSPKVLKLVKNLKDFDYILTDTEFEAFMLECKLIKEIKPIYNKQMKSPKSYSYIKIRINEKYPDIEISSECNENDGNLYFGPYTNRNTVERGLQGIKECCKILCNSNSQRNSSCLNYSLGLCIGMCLDSTPRQQYLDIVNNITLLLNGKDKSIIEKMKSNMNMASENFNFELAAKYRDYLNSLNSLIDKVKIVEYTKENKNIALIEPLENGNIKFFIIKGNKVLFSEKYLLAGSDCERIKCILRNNILFYFNSNPLECSINIGKYEVDEAQIIYTYLKSRSNNCKYSIISEKCLNDLSYISIDNAINTLLS